MKPTVYSFFLVFFFFTITNGQEVQDSVSSNTSVPNQNIELNDDPCSYGIPHEKSAVPIKQVQPDLPQLGPSYRIRATIWVKAFVDSLGDVLAVKILKSDAEIFNEVVLAAAKQWKFSPAIMNGRPIGCWVTIPFKIGINEKRVVEQNQKEYKPVKPRTIKPEKKYHKPKKK
ncbi:MAG: TonB family protein [Ignavibacteriae bacterium]|nr:TonB family protein [Ignavibacteriota bacterium]